ncbi:glycosyltransferase family 1 protein [Exiguobacterium sp. SH5S4]|uniref:glycosyltransferase n=1 Tax=Exiguobacterium sp. SH5S4 TaxID=2510961 RepID=UPI00103F3E46|nr:glycosyltransferase [Exiguobacterium sp. SH5S4]TCI25134.1 glycosyltransferase family 1 protein [Exiguobacterium sp. SH5S4]
MTRVLHIVSSLSKSSGVMSFIMNFYRKIDKENIQFDFLYWETNEVDYINEIEDLGGNIYKIPKPKIGLIYSQETEFYKKVSKYKIVHLHENYLVSFFSVLRYRNKDMKLIAHAHTTKYSDKFLNSIRNRILCSPINLIATNFFACSKKAGEVYFGKNKVKNKKVKIINNAIDFKVFLPNSNLRNSIRKDLGVTDELVICHVGRFNQQKNHEKIIEIFKEVHKKNKESKLILVGNGPLRAEIENQIKKYELNEVVTILNPGSNISNIMQASDVFLLPSKFEGLGIVLIEAQVIGLECYASDVVPSETIISNKIQFFSLKKDAMEWASLILKSIQGRELKKITQFNKNAEEFNVDLVVNHLENEYLNLH